MPSFTLGQIMSIATTNVGRRADIPISEVSLRANIAYLEIAEDVPHALHELIAVSSTSSGDRRIPLPADFNEPISLQLTIFSNATNPTLKSYKTLNLLSAYDADASWSDTVGEPEDVVFYNRWLELLPSPNSAYSIQLRYRSSATDMLETTQVPSMATGWRPAILYRTEALLHEYLGNFPAAAAAQQRYLSFVQSRKDTEAKRQSSQHKTNIQPVYPRVTYS